MMHRTFHRLLLAAAVAVSFFLAPAAAESRALFDGRTLANWQGNPAYWRIEDGAITGEITAGQTLARNEFLYWSGEVGDFELTAEFRLVGTNAVNAGVQFRSVRLPDGQAQGYQADLDLAGTAFGRLHDEHGRGMLAERGTRVSLAPDGRKWSEAFASAASLAGVFKRNAWNTLQLSARASHVDYRINGVLMAALDDHDAKSARTVGVLALQLHSGVGPVKVQFRNLRLQESGRTETPPPPDAAAGHNPSAGIAPAGADGKPLNLGFETGTLEGWQVEGTAWHGQPVKFNTANPPKRRDESGAGIFWIGALPPRGDGGTGTLTSPSFVVNQPWASFLVGGAGTSSVARVEVVEESTGRILHQASGENSEALRREVVDLSGVQGQRVFVRLIDQGAGPAHVNFDDFVLHAEQPVFAENVVGDAHRVTESPVLWHLRPNAAAPSGVANAAAQKLVAGMKLTAGFQAELIAAEPDIRQPVAFAIDARGRLWVAEAYGYPARQKDGEGKDRIVIFEDANGDGSFETRKVFIEKLNLVSGLELGFGGVWVGAAPHLLFIPDRDRDDVPDAAPEVLLDGWGSQDTHETLNSFTWGPDGWLYGTQGVFTHSRVGRPGAPAAERSDLRAGVWRFHPVRREFELFARGGSNQWGLDFNAHGHLFMTHCRSFHGGGGTSYVIRNGHYWNQANANHAPFISNSAPAFAPELKNFLPASARYDSGEGGAGRPGSGAIFGGHSHVGTMIYLGDNWPDIYRDHLFTHNLHGHQLNHQVNERVGSGYETFHGGYDLLFSPDPTYLPVDLQYGPDGAVYAIDWSDNQHCHVTAVERWDRTNGRLYRVAWAKTFRPVTVDLVARSDRELVELHTHRNEWYARTARRLLQERAAARPLERGALARLRALFLDSAEVPLALRALFTLHAIGAADRELVATALRHGSDTIRGHAIALATERTANLLVKDEVLESMARRDPSASVRLALASAIPALPVESRWRLAGALAMNPADAGDRFLPKMIWFGLATVASDDLSRALALAEQTVLPGLADSIRWFVAGTADGREQVAAFLARCSDDRFGRALGVLAFRLEKEAGLVPPPSWPAVLGRARQSGRPETVAAADRMAALFGDEAVRERLRIHLSDTSLALAERRSALEVLKRTNDPAALPIYLAVLGEEGLRGDVIPVLGTIDDPAAADALLQVYPALASPRDRTAAIAALTGRPALTVPFLQAVRAGRFDRELITPLHLRQLRSQRDPAVVQLVSEIWGRPAATSGSSNRATIARYEKLLADGGPRDRSAGKAVYQRLCLACHTLNGEGGRLGPDLTGSAGNGARYFIENIVDPNAVVGENFQLNVFTKTDGSVVSGMVESQTATAVVVRTVSETISLPKTQIRDRQISAQSLMPAGLLESLSDAEAADLLAFLSAP